MFKNKSEKIHNERQKLRAKKIIQQHKKWHKKIGARTSWPEQPVKAG